MSEESNLLDGERPLGQYTVGVLERSLEGHWMPSVMPLSAIVTNYRLVLSPHKKKYQPATLPSHFIGQVNMATRDRYNCIELIVKSGHRLCLLMSTGKLDDLYHDLSAMKAPPPKFHFDEKIAQKDIERLIAYLENQHRVASTRQD
ncbi:MAG: hypothetical protein CL607_16905 [Anaerolineaceae bacterium]|nr:hypothetical protein [Anaerolineaceae bacterium]